MTEQGRGCYVYCIVEATERLSLDGLMGVDPAFEVTTITTGALSAVLSEVGLDEFGAEPLKRHLEDLGWLERIARAHDAVLARAMSAHSVVPLRLCTIFTDESHVVDMLTEERERLLDALRRLRGHAEYSVKLLADPRRLEQAARERAGQATGSAGPDTSGAGHAYFARKKADRLVREEARAIAQAAAEETHDYLRGHATAATLLPPQHPELSGRAGEMLLNGAYLVDGSEYGAFAAVADELRQRRRAAGLELVLSGPWAPYNFVFLPHEPT